MQPDLFTDDGFSKWQKWHRANPHVWRIFEKFALQAIASGRKNYSARTIMERVRWHTEITTKGDTFKINNNFFPYYARLFMNVHPQHEGFFHTRSKEAA